MINRLEQLEERDLWIPGGFLGVPNGVLSTSRNTRPEPKKGSRSFCVSNCPSGRGLGKEWILHFCCITGYWILWILLYVDICTVECYSDFSCITSVYMDTSPMARWLDGSMARWLDGSINGSIDVARWLDANGRCLQPRCLDARRDAGLDAKLDAGSMRGSMRGSMQARCLEAGAQRRRMDTSGMDTVPMDTALSAVLHIRIAVFWAKACNIAI